MDIVYFFGDCGVIPKILMKYVGNLKFAVVQAGKSLGNLVLSYNIILFNKNTFTSYFLITLLDFLEKFKHLHDSLEIELWIDLMKR